tara:strand:- start:880 stop:2403 length:1524 start_codon:yes stop_codon:yes gene_type:complete
MSQRDLTITVSPSTEKEMQLSEVTFLYLKSITGATEIQVVIDGMPNIMAEGDLKRFVKPIDKATLQNIDGATIATCVFVTGTGEFIRTKLFAGADGFLSAESTIKTLTNNTEVDTRTEREFIIRVEEEGVFSEVGGTVLFNNTTPTGNRNDLCFSPFSSVGFHNTNLTHEKVDKEGNFLTSAKSVSLFGGQRALYAFTQNSFVSPATGYLICTTHDNVSGNLRFHQYNERQNFGLFVGGLTNAGGEPWRNVTVDWHTGNLLARYGQNPTLIREFKFTPKVGVNLLADSEHFDLTAVRDISVPENYDVNIDAIYMMADRRILHYPSGNFYDGETFALESTYASHVSGDAGVLNTATQGFYCDERANRIYQMSNTKYQKHTFLDLSGSIKLSIANSSDMSQNFEHWRTPMIMGTVTQTRDGGQRFLSGDIGQTVCKLIIGAQTINENYLDYIYGIRYHDGNGWRETNTGRDSFAVAGIPDNFKINLNYPITLKTRSGLVDNAPAGFIND